jgi:muramoyltetrapeptide carboxypeptidase LdcA involved in peptidoglycan recycling
MPIRYPSALRPGERIGVTAPSSGVASKHRPRLNFCVDFLRNKGFDVVVGSCIDGTSYVSAPAADRAAELSAMLVDPTIRAVIPPWGGELAIDLLPHLDWAQIALSAPTWFIGFSDISTLITPLTLSTGIATLHGNNLMDTPYAVPPPLLSWLDIVTLPSGSSFEQGPAGGHREPGFDDWELEPTVTTYPLDAPGSWTRLNGLGEVSVSGRMIGGCIETLSNLTGTPYGDLAGFARDHAPDGLLVYVEAAEASSYDIGRRLHGMKLAGWFADANAVLVGRTAAADQPGLSQHEAVVDALGDLDIPIIADVDFGHVPPYMPIVNGALGSLSWSPDVMSLKQTLS